MGAVLGMSGAAGATFRALQDGGRTGGDELDLLLALSHLLMANLCCTLELQEPVSLCRRRIWASHSTAGETIKLRHGALESGPLGVHGGCGSSHSHLCLHYNLPDRHSCAVLC